MLSQPNQTLTTMLRNPSQLRLFLFVVVLYLFAGLALSQAQTQWPIVLPVSIGFHESTVPTPNQILTTR